MKPEPKQGCREPFMTLPDAKTEAKLLIVVGLSENTVTTSHNYCVISYFRLQYLKGWQRILLACVQGA